MKKTGPKLRTLKTPAIASSALLAFGFGVGAYAQPSAPQSDPVVDALIQKGILSQDEAAKIEAEIAARQSNSLNQAAMPASKWKIADTIKNIQLFGDVRFRYEYRGADNLQGASPSTFYRERFRYAFRAGIRGDLFDDFNYGIRVETSTNPRSPWATFGNNTTGGSVTPSDKAQSGINVGQLYLGWHPADWFEMTIGRMPMPLYVTPMVWDSDINPEGAFEKFKYNIGDVNLFADFGQFDYQDPGSATEVPSGDTFILAWQAGASAKINSTLSIKAAPVLYTYTGHGTSGGLNLDYTGEGNATGGNPNFGGGAAFNQNGINDLLVLEAPVEFNFELPHTPLGPLHARLFGDFAYNIDGDKRAEAATTTAGLPHTYKNDVKAYQVGFGIGSAGPVYGPTQGLVYGSTSKKNTWELRTYWQHIEQYSLDVNLIDSDFFEGRANLEGIYTSFAYSFTDSIIGTLRYGHADRINNNLGTGGNNLDLPGLNPIRNYNLFQADITWRF